MIELNLLFNELCSMGIDFYTGVPDSLLNDFCLYLEHNMPENKHVMAANEGNAVAIAAGYNMSTGKLPLVYMQNSGIGNSANPLISLTHKSVYSIPMILLIGWRGDPSINDHVQHRKQGVLTPILMEDMDIPYRVLDSDDEIIGNFKWAVEEAQSQSSPVALIVKKGILSKKEKEIVSCTDSKRMNREEVISVVLDYFKDESIFLATIGRATRELHEQVSLKGYSHSIEFLNVGAMGHLSSIGLGMAIGAPHKKIVCFDGDASTIMHLGSYATTGRYIPNNLIHIVLNNGVNESVGGQKSPGQIISLTKVARACGYSTIESHIETKDELLEALTKLKNTDAPTFIDIYIRQGIREGISSLNEINLIEQKRELMNLLLID